MPITSWKPSLSVGVDSIDDDHRRLIDVMNEVFDSLLSGPDSSTARKALQRLNTYVVEHFRREEEWMAQTGFPELLRHQEQHQQLRDKISDLLKQSEQGGDEVALDLLIVLRDWLLRHIAGSDQAVAVSKAKLQAG